jgi:hypothetical protein
MDRIARTSIQRTTQAARALLEQEFAEQLEGVFDIRLDGTIAAGPGVHLDASQRVVRTKLVAAIGHLRASGHITQGEAVAAYLREASFATLNRFVALKMLEARGLVQECISRGEQSSGFKEFCGLAPGLVQLPDHGYRLYIESLFDELSVHVQVLFNRRDASSLLWPKRATIDRLLAVLNDPELAGVWGEDETIGWVYQYYNDEAERKRMREESAAPRNSRELAVRNQFFTPRYVVEFLTDNTLGRLWYEMTQGQTRLKEQCHYLVRRPTEIFLAEGEQAPDESSVVSHQSSDGESSVISHQSSAGANPADDRRPKTEDLTQEELLRQPACIPHRPLKDPREIGLLDPACGSMHFGLYAFDLFLTIYDEAWDLDLPPTSPGVAVTEGLQPLRDRYPTKEEYLFDVPRLIIEHNVHGIDIDRRAVQIAGLSLWLRAQRAWHEAGVKPADRPRFRRSNIVCAEPMPGEKELLRDFVDQQFPAPERPAFAFLLDKVFDRMALAGEAGSLLRIEEEIRDAIAEARALAKEQAAPRQLQLLAGDAPPEQTRLDLSGLTDQQFWQAAEQRIYEALRAYAEQAENGSGFRRRLFADDAAEGFAFIDHCRKRYDVVVMNPPFGRPPERSTEYLYQANQSARKDLLAAFVERAAELAVIQGRIGAITGRLALFNDSLENWRERFFLGKQASLEYLADLGWNVLDGATVEAAAYVLTKQPNLVAIAIDLTAEQHKDVQLVAALKECRIIPRALSAFGRLPGRPLSYFAPTAIMDVFTHRARLKDIGVAAGFGVETGDDFRFLRLHWETPAIEVQPMRRWTFLAKGGDYNPWSCDLHLMIDVSLLALMRRASNTELYGRSGVTWTERTSSNPSLPVFFQLKRSQFRPAWGRSSMYRQPI